jgi:hypothetical protein
LDIAEYDLEIYEENPEDHEHHGSNWTRNAKKIEGTVVGKLPIRKDLRLVTEEGYALSFYLRDSFGSIVILGTHGWSRETSLLERASWFTR